MSVSRKVWPWTRTLIGVAVLVVVLWQLGAGPFVRGFEAVTVRDVAAALLLTFVITLASAWRWSIVAGRLGLPLTTRAAVPAYYRSQFINGVLPGGVLGDVHRAVRHGRDIGDLGGGVRSVAWDRFVGQVVQNVLVVAVLVALPSPLRTVEVAVIGGVALAVVAAIGWLLLHRGSPHRAGLLSRLRRILAGDLRALVAEPKAVVGMVVASMAVTGGHVATFLVALRATGTDLSLSQALPLTMVVLAAASIPGSLAGWGPREGVAAWAFAAAGVGAAAGVAATSAYGLLRLVSTLPGAVLLLQPGGSSLRGTAPTRSALPTGSESA